VADKNILVKDEALKSLKLGATPGGATTPSADKCKPLGRKGEMPLEKNNSHTSEQLSVRGDPEYTRPRDVGRKAPSKKDGVSQIKGSPLVIKGIGEAYRKKKN